MLQLIEPFAEEVIQDDAAQVRTPPSAGTYAGGNPLANRLSHLFKQRRDTIMPKRIREGLVGTIRATASNPPADLTREIRRMTKTTRAGCKNNSLTGAGGVSPQNFRRKKYTLPQTLFLLHVSSGISHCRNICAYSIHKLPNEKETASCLQGFMATTRPS